MSESPPPTRLPQEVVDEIFQWYSLGLVITDGDSEPAHIVASRRSVLNFMLLNVAFSRPAIRFRWKVMDTLIPLLLLLPCVVLGKNKTLTIESATWFITTELHAPQFASKAILVREVRLGPWVQRISGTALSFLREFADFPLLPRLETIRVGGDPGSDANIMTFNLLILCAPIRHLEFSSMAMTRNQNNRGSTAITSSRTFMQQMVTRLRTHSTFKELTVVCMPKEPMAALDIDWDVVTTSAPIDKITVRLNYPGIDHSDVLRWVQSLKWLSLSLDIPSFVQDVNRRYEKDPLMVVKIHTGVNQLVELCSSIPSSLVFLRKCPGINPPSVQFISVETFTLEIDHAWNASIFAFLQDGGWSPVGSIQSVAILPKQKLTLRDDLLLGMVKLQNLQELILQFDRVVIFSGQPAMADEQFRELLLAISDARLPLAKLELPRRNPLSLVSLEYLAKFGEGLKNVRITVDTDLQPPGFPLLNFGQLPSPIPAGNSLRKLSIFDSRKTRMDVGFHRRLALYIGRVFPHLPILEAYFPSTTADTPLDDSTVELWKMIVATRWSN